VTTTTIPCAVCCNNCLCSTNPKTLTISFFSGGTFGNTAEDSSWYCSPCASGNLPLTYHYGHPVHFLPTYSLTPSPVGGPPLHFSDFMNSNTRAHLWEFYVGDGASASSYPTLGTCPMYALDETVPNWIIPSTPYNVARIKYIRMYCSNWQIPNSNPPPSRNLIIELETAFYTGGILRIGSTMLNEMPFGGFQECDPFYKESYIYRPNGSGQFDIYAGGATTEPCSLWHNAYIFPNFKVVVTE